MARKRSPETWKSLPTASKRGSAAAQIVSFVPGSSSSSAMTCAWGTTVYSRIVYGQILRDGGPGRCYGDLMRF